jgi:hypothetical protein
MARLRLAGKPSRERQLTAGNALVGPGLWSLALLTCGDLPHERAEPPV